MEELRTTSESIQFIVTQMGDEQYGIDIKYVDNIVRMQRTTRVPKVAPYIRGVINLRGEVIPIMNLRKKMELPEVEDTNSTRIIIVKLEQQGLVGLIVDEVKEVVTLDVDRIEKVSYDKDEKNMFLMGVGKNGDALISLLDLNAVVSE
ncbi:MAG: chemotaxis protein CheW [Lachnospiraceae bacterium]|nr:chemotaxis protein CheW [Lachnospiraceae bacterium]